MNVQESYSPALEQGTLEDGDTRTEDSSVLYKTVNEDLPADLEGTVTPEGCVESMKLG